MGHERDGTGLHDCCHGLPNSRIAREVGVSRPTVILWRERFRQGGPDGLTKIAPGRGRPVTYNADRVNVGMVRYDGGMRKPTSSLEAWVRAQNTPQSVVRARIVLLSADVTQLPDR